MYGSSPYGSLPLGGFFPFDAPTPSDKRIKIFYKNILENGAVTVTTENTSYPKYRLYDRDIGLLFKGNSTPSQFQINIDQGVYAINPGVDKIIIPSGHNFSGKTVRLYHSLDGVTYEQILAWVMPSDRYEKDLPYTEKRYWRFGIDSPSSAPEFSELWLGKSYEFERGPSYGYDRGMKDNINRIESKSGQSQKTIWGLERKRRRYDLTKISNEQRIELEIFRTFIYGKNFYIEDVEGELFFVELPEGLGDFRSEQINRWGLTLNVLEILA